MHFSGKGPKQVVDEDLLPEEGGTVGRVVVGHGDVLVGVGVLAQAEALGSIARDLHGAVSSGVGEGGMHTFVSLASEDSVVL